MRAVLIAVLIFGGIGVLAWATAQPNDGRANANAKASFPKPAVDVPLAASKSEETALFLRILKQREEHRRRASERRLWRWRWRGRRWAGLWPRPGLRFRQKSKQQSGQHASSELPKPYSSTVYACR